MSKKIFYRYNPSTDNYERVYPTLKQRVLSIVKHLVFGVVFCSILFVSFYYLFDSPGMESLRQENNELRFQYELLQRRLNYSLNIMEDIKKRDDNFYRVMMQMEPMEDAQRYAGLDNEQRYKELQKLSDSELVSQVTRGIDLLDRQLYVQSLSFDQLKNMAQKQKDKILHIPSILPISLDDYTMSSGYGYRRDPVYGSTRFHEGLDFAAPTGTPVYATADGRVSEAGWASGYGNVVNIEHGYNYLTRYAHLSKITVTSGQEVKRGDKIGEVGSTGKSTGPHLHYEVRFKNEPQNPVNYYFMDLTEEEYNDMIQEAENAGHVMD